MAESTAWWEPFIEAGAALVGAAMDNKGEDDAADAQRQGQERALGLQRDIYQDQRNLFMPNYLTGGAATNKLAAMFGIGPQDYQKAASGGLGSALGSYNPSQWGAGQPVAGHTGGGGNYAGEGAIAGNLVGMGPLGGIIGGGIGSLIRKGGDNWKTLGTSAPQGFAYDEYFNSSPEFAKEWAKPDVQALFNGNRDAYIWWHANGGQMDGRQSWAPNTDWLNRGPGGNTQSPQSAPGGAGAGAGNALGDPMQDFWTSPYGKLATEGFLNVDTPEVQGAYATSGKLLSGSQQKALYDRGRARAGGAFTEYGNALRSLSGMNQVAGSQISSAGSQYGANAGNAFANIGDINANKSMQLNANWRKGVGSALGAFY